MSEFNQVTTAEHGGYREGAGRKTGSRQNGRSLGKQERLIRLERLQRIANIKPTSYKVMHAMGGAEYWLDIIGQLEKERDWRTIVDVMRFHQQMDEGRPAQRIHVTGTTVSLSVIEVQRARDVVRELVAPKVIAGELTEHNALGGQGAKEDG